MNNRQMLLDTFEYKGNTEETLKENISFLANNTNCISLKTKDITILSLCKIASLQKPGMALFYILSQEYITDFIEFGDKLRMGSIPINEIGQELYDELESTTGLMLVINNQKFLVSKDALLTMCQQACISGDMTTCRANICRDLHLADGLFQRTRGVSIVYRTIDGVNKIFAMFASNHTHIGQNLILDALDDSSVKSIIKNTFNIDSVIIEDFTISNTLTEVKVSFTQNETVRAGLLLSDSDTGHSSITVKSIWYVGNEYVIQEEYLLKHSAKANVSEFAKLIIKAIADLKNSDFPKKISNIHSNLQTSVEDVVFEAYGNCMSQQRRNYLSAAIKEEIPNPTIENIAMALFKAPQILSFVDKGKKTLMRRSAYDIPAKISALGENAS